MFHPVLNRLILGLRTKALEPDLACTSVNPKLEDTKSFASYVCGTRCLIIKGAVPEDSQCEVHHMKPSKPFKNLFPPPQKQVEHCQALRYAYPGVPCHINHFSDL